MSKSTTKNGPMSLRGYGRHRGVSLAAVQRAIRDGRLTKAVVKVAGVTKIRSAAEADAEWAANTDGARVDPAKLAAALAPSPLDTPDVNAARIRLLTVQAQLHEHELKVKEGTFVPAAEVEGAWADVVTAARTKLLGVAARYRQ